MLIEIDISEELANRLHFFEDKIPQILELGLREFNATTAIPTFSGTADILEFLAAQPSPQEVLELRPSENLQNQINTLLEKNRHQSLTQKEQQQWEHYEYLEHLVRMAKAKAYLKIKAS